MPSYATASLLSHRTVLRVSGADRDGFLQGLISNDIALCTPEKSLYAALLTPQGKFLHDMFFYHAGEEYIVDCEAERADDLAQRLSAYKLRAKVTIEKAGDEFDVVAFFEEAERNEALPPWGKGWVGGQVKNNSHDFDPPSAKTKTYHSQASDKSKFLLPPPKGGGLHTALADPRCSALGWRGVIKKNSDLKFVDASNYNYHRLKLGIADGSRDMMVGKSTLSDGNFDLLNGVSWTKGCYVGQELTARMHHRALVKKRMFPVKISGAAPKVGAVIQLDGVEMGEMRSAEKDFGLALLNIDRVKKAAQAQHPALCEGALLTPSIPDWLTDI